MLLILILYYLDFFSCIFIHFCRAFSYITKMCFHYQLMRFHKTAILKAVKQQVVKVIWQQAASPPHMNGSMVFARWRQCVPEIHASLGPFECISKNGMSIDSAVLTQLTAVSRYTLQRAVPFPLKITPSHGGSEPPSITWFLWPTRVISIGSAVFAWLTTVTDRPTDHAILSL